MMHSRFVIMKRWRLTVYRGWSCILFWNALSTAYKCLTCYPLGNVGAARINSEGRVGWSSGIGGFLRYENAMSGNGDEYECGYGRVVPNEITPDNPLNVRIAGGGIGGLVAAKYMKQFGINVVVHEKARNFGMFGGPIQLASNALSTIKAMDSELFDRIMGNFTFTAVRVNGIKDGLKNEWYVKFAAITRVANRLSLPYTGVISRPDLHEILMEYLDDDEVVLSDAVAGYEHKENGVKLKMRNGDTNEADVLIGADGIWSNIRAQMHNEPAKPSKGKERGIISYTGVTVFAGQTLFQPEDYWDVGHKVYVGRKKYFVTSDAGQGVMQWYGFISVPEGTEIQKDKRMEFLRKHFASWSHDIHTLLNATHEEGIEQRDMFDSIPSIFRLIFKPWSKGHVTLLGDSCHGNSPMIEPQCVCMFVSYSLSLSHIILPLGGDIHTAMMPSLGQGGCQAVEDAYVLTNILKDVKRRSELPDALQSYYKQRIIRATVIQYLSRISNHLLMHYYNTPASIQFYPFRIEVPHGLVSIITSVCRPIISALVYFQFRFVIACVTLQFNP